MWLRNRNASVGRAVARIAAVIALLVLPVFALAQDPDAEQPLDPRAAALQLRTYGVVVLVAVLVAGWYGFRRWQLRHMNSTGHDSRYRDQD